MDKIELVNIRNRTADFKYGDFKINASFYGYRHNNLEIRKGRKKFDIWYYGNDKAMELIKKLNDEKIFEILRIVSKTNYRTQERYVYKILNNTQLDLLKKGLDSNFKALKTKAKNIWKMEKIRDRKFKMKKGMHYEWDKDYVWNNDKDIIFNGSYDRYYLFKVYENKLYALTPRNCLNYFEGRKYKSKEIENHDSYTYKDFFTDVLETKLLPKNLQQELEKIVVVNAI